MLKTAFNSLVSIHSRAAQLRRPGTVDIYSPCRICPSNYNRINQGPEFTAIEGREFVIPADSILGQFAQTVVFGATAVSGNFKLGYNGNDTADLAFNISASSLQTALRGLAGLEDVLVTGSVAAGFSVTFQGFSSEPLILVPSSITLVDSLAAPVSVTATKIYLAWTKAIKRGDKIIDSVYGALSIEEVIEMVDLGGAPMGFRVRCNDA